MKQSNKKDVENLLDKLCEPGIVEEKVPDSKFLDYCTNYLLTRLGEGVSVRSALFEICKWQRVRTLNLLPGNAKYVEFSIVSPPTKKKKPRTNKKRQR